MKSPADYSDPVTFNFCLAGGLSAYLVKESPEERLPTTTCISRKKTRNFWERCGAGRVTPTMKRMLHYWEEDSQRSTKLSLILRTTCCPLNFRKQMLQPLSSCSRETCQLWHMVETKLCSGYLPNSRIRVFKFPKHGLINRKRVNRIKSLHWTQSASTLHRSSKECLGLGNWLQQTIRNKH